jgi:hypothetical protein
VTPRRLQRFLRNLTLLCAAVGGLYLWNRYELIDLPAEGRSPLASLSPGNRLWVDLMPGRFVVGDVLFYSPPDGELSFGRVQRIEAEPERYWVVVDAPDLVARSSEGLGWIPRDWIQGRLMMALDL